MTDLPNGRSASLPTPPTQIEDIEVRKYLESLKAALELELNKAFDNSNVVRNAADAAQTTADGAVLLTGDQTVAGVKTFSSFPVTPSSAPTTDYQAANKKYVDDKTTSYVRVSEQRAAGTHGGTFTSGDWRARELNTEDSDASSLASVASSQVTLAAGTYVFRGFATAAQVNGHILRLYNATDASAIAVGISAYASTADGGTTTAYISGKFTIGATKALELQHRCTTTAATTGLGVATDVTVAETYAILEFWKVG